MTNLLQNDSANIFRAKGVLAIHGREDKYVLQAVHETIDLGQATTSWKEGEKRVSKYVCCIYLLRMLTKECIAMIPVHASAKI